MRKQRSSHDSDEFDAAQASERFVAALRGARIASQTTMKEISPKRAKRKKRPKGASSVSSAT